MRDQPAQQLAGQVARKPGKVKFFDPVRGFGFIIGRDGQDYFFNANYVKGVAAVTGVGVEFESGQSSSGKIAKNMRVVTVSA